MALSPEQVLDPGVKRLLAEPLPPKGEAHTNHQKAQAGLAEINKPNPKSKTQKRKANKEAHMHANTKSLRK